MSSLSQRKQSACPKSKENKMNLCNLHEKNRLAGWSMGKPFNV
jgi:hypothetical protein